MVDQIGDIAEYGPPCPHVAQVEVEVVEVKEPRKPATAPAQVAPEAYRQTDSGLMIADAAVGTAKLADGAVSNGKLADGSVTAAKIGQACSEGQILKRINGAWTCATDEHTTVDSDTTYSAGKIYHGNYGRKPTDHEFDHLALQT